MNTASNQIPCHKTNININVGIIDSLSLRIPFDECDVIDPNLISKTEILYIDTGEITNQEFPPVPYKIVVDGITFRIRIVNIPIYDKDSKERITTKFIEIVLTSKLLRERYFQGITKSNLEYFYETFMSYEVFYCDYDTFISSQVFDIDICINRYCDNIEVWQDIIHSLYNQSGTKQKYLRKFLDTNSLGLQFSSRESAKPSLPFIKLYHKELEMHSKSADFYNTYLFPKFEGPLKGLTRIEATIKNAKHKQRLFKYSILPKFDTLEELVNIEEIYLRKFVVFSISSYVTGTIRKKAPNLSPTDHLLFRLMESCVMNGYDFSTLENLVNDFKGSSPEVTEVSKSRMRKKVKDIFDLLIHKDFKIQAKEKHNKHVISYLKFIGLHL